MVTFKFTSPEMMLLAAKAAYIEARGKDPEAALLVADDPKKGLRGYVLYARVGDDRDLDVYFAWEVSKVGDWNHLSPAVKTFLGGTNEERVGLGVELPRTTVLFDFLTG